MMGQPWYKAIWRLFDGTLRSISDTLQSIVRVLRITRVVMALLVVLMLLVAVFVILRPEYSHYVLAAVVVLLTLPIVAIFGLASLPFRAKSAVRLIDQGYPENVKELTIRAVARKFHDESIATEELLVDTAVNESRKALSKYRTRLERLRAELDAMEEAAGASGEGPPLEDRSERTPSGGSRDDADRPEPLSGSGPHDTDEPKRDDEAGRDR